MWRRRINRRCWGATTLKRHLSTTTTNKQDIVRRDEGSWCYSPEWWGSDHSDHLSHSVFRASSHHGNGIVSVLAYPSSLPSCTHWPETEHWLQKRYAEVCPDRQHDEYFKILGYQWRVLRFNDTTRQSTVKVMAVAKMPEPESVYYMQQPHCLAIPYVKSMVSSGLAALSTCNFDLQNAARGQKNLRVLCVGHGGGSLPLFLASKIQGAVVDVVEIDPLVISASVDAMGFPSFSLAANPGQHALLRANAIDEVLWGGIHERLFLYESDADKFILNSSDLYDIIFIDAYDGDDIFPRKLWDSDSPFLEALGARLHPCHGTVVVNLHSDADIVSPDASTTTYLEPLLPMGKYVSQVSRAYKDMVVGKTSAPCPGFGFTVSVPWVCNTTLVVCRGFDEAVGGLNKDMVLNNLISNALEVERELDIPFSTLQYLKRCFVLLD